jgi:hypothetical protein
MKPANASHRPAPSRLRIHPLAASLGLALAFGAAERAVALPEFWVGLIPNRPWFGISGLHRQPGPALLAAPKSGPGTAPSGDPLMVQNCEDSGVGSLRDTIATAPSGATIGFGDLACSAITLNNGAIAIKQNTLRIEGPGSDVIGIDGNDLARVFLHSGYGQLSIHGLTIANGRYGSASGPPTLGDRVRQSPTIGGGCIYSYGNLELTGVTVENCVIDVDLSEDFGIRNVVGGGVMAVGTLRLDRTIIRDCRLHMAGDTDNEDAAAFGGGAAAFSAGNVNETIMANGLGESAIDNSRIYGNTISSDYGAAGGGLYLFGNLRLSGSTIGNNSVISAAGSRHAMGGGVYHRGTLLMRDSTISANHAGILAGLSTLGSDATSQVIENSTISGNLSDSVVAGVYCHGYCTIRNSTVAFNEATLDSMGSDHDVAAGVAIFGNGALHSVVIAGNEAAGLPADFGLLSESSQVFGSGNLIVAPRSPPPTDTIVGEDPLLGPLARNGGPTATHALSPGSPALDAGFNIADLETDQRGAGFARQVGASVDIGAFEVDPDRIFHNDFDGG